MKFTIVFPSSESNDFSIGVVFKPCLVWMQGREDLSNPHPESPAYIQGDLRDFLSMEGMRDSIATHTNVVTVIVLPVGHGTIKCLALLTADLEAEGFLVNVVSQ